MRIRSGLGTVVTALSFVACGACSSITPTPARVAPAFTGDAACHATGTPKVLARGAFVPRGVQATEQDGGFTIRFASAASRCVAVDWASDPGAPRAASCPAPGPQTTARADARDETLLAWESRDEEQPRIKLGVVTYDAPHAFFGVGIEAKQHVVERTFYPPGAGRDGGQMAPELAPIGHDRFLLAWVDGNVESHALRAQSVAGWGDPLGASMLLSPSEASVIGRPSVVVASTGYGLVTYLASIDGEFDVLATPIACAMN